MKKIICISLGAIALLAGCYVLFFGRTNMDFVKSGRVTLLYGESNVSEPLNEEDLALFCEIFNGKMLYWDQPSCGFSENVAIRFNDAQTFCFANDSCSVIYWKEKDRYFSITEAERQKAYDFFMRYDFTFPCV